MDYMILNFVKSVTIHYRDNSEVVITAPKNCHLRVTDIACARPKQIGDVVRVEEIENGVVNVGADYIYTNISWYRVR